MEFYDPLESCPYNPKHRIHRTRMQFHIVRCAQEHKHVKGLVKCPFDARHIIKSIEFEHHKKTCPGRALVLDYAIYDEAKRVKLRILPIIVNPTSEWTENWDKDPDVKTYDPMQYVKSRLITYPLIGVPKINRRIHRLQERIRWRRLIENDRGPMSDNKFYSRSKCTRSRINTMVEIVCEIGDNTDEGNKPLRTPTTPKTHLDNAFDDFTRGTSKSSERTDQEILVPQKVAQSSNDSFSSPVEQSGNEKKILSKNSSENSWFSEKSPRVSKLTTVNNNDNIRDTFHEGIIVSSKDDYQFKQYQPNDQEKFADSYVDYNISEKDFQLTQHQVKDEEKLGICDSNSMVSSWDDYNFREYQPKNQEKPIIPNADNLVPSRDYHQIKQYQYKYKENLCNYDMDSSRSSTENGEFESSEYPEYCSIPDTQSMVSSINNYQFYECRCGDHYAFPISDTISIISGNSKYQCYQHHESLEMSETQPTYSYIEDDLVNKKLLVTVKERIENNKNNKNIKDIVFNVSNENESQHMRLKNGDSDTIPSSSDILESSNNSLSNEIVPFGNHSITSIKSHSDKDVTIFDKLSKSIQELAMENEDYLKKSVSLDHKIEELKKLQSNNKSRQTISSVQWKKGKLFPRCGANFLKLNQ